MRFYLLLQNGEIFNIVNCKLVFFLMNNDKYKKLFLLHDSGSQILKESSENFPDSSDFPR